MKRLNDFIVEKLNKSKIAVKKLFNVKQMWKGFEVAIVKKDDEGWNKNSLIELFDYTDKHNDDNLKQLIMFEQNNAKDTRYVCYDRMEDDICIFTTDFGKEHRKPSQRNWKKFKEDVIKSNYRIIQINLETAGTKVEWPIETIFLSVSAWESEDYINIAFYDGNLKF